MIRQQGIFFLAAGTVALHLLCTTTQISGPSTEEGNPQIVAVVVDSLKQPVPGVSITAYRLAPLVDTLQIPSEATEIAHGLTDASGECSFDSLPAGIYSITAADLETDRRALQSGLVITDEVNAPRLTDTLMLDRPGGFRGFVTRGGNLSNQNLQDAGIMVIIQEIARSMLTPPNGAYSFTGLPAGTYTVIYYATDGFISARRSIKVNPGDDTFPVDTVFLKPSRLLPPKGFTGSYDTLAGLVHLSWQRVDYDSIRWYEVLRFDFNGPYNDTLRTTDTFVVDSVNSIPSETELTYVIRSVDRALNTSDNAGPVEIKVAGSP